MKGAHFPTRVQIHHKMNQRVVELGFQRRNVKELLAIRSHWPKTIFAVQKGKTASLVMNVPEIDMKKSIAEQEAQLEVVFAAVTKLIQYARLFENVWATGFVRY